MERINSELEREKRYSMDIVERLMKEMFSRHGWKDEESFLRHKWHAENINRINKKMSFSKSQWKKE